MWLLIPRVAIERQLRQQMMVLAVVRTGGASGGRGSLIKDILNGAESAVEIKAPSVPLSIMLGLRH